MARRIGIRFGEAWEARTGYYNREKDKWEFS